MWKCHKCGKDVYFAERKQSLGYDWHPECLRCEECGKRLNPGQHAEHKGTPYCDVPCYSVLFGPTLFGHGSQVESHKSFGMEKRLPPGVDKIVLESKLKVYNHYYEGNSCQLAWKERNGKLTLEGVLHIYWGVSKLIHLRENEDQRHHVQARKRNSYRESLVGSLGDEQSFDNGELKKNNSVGKYSTLPSRKLVSPINGDSTVSVESKSNSENSAMELPVVKVDTKPVETSITFSVMNRPDSEQKIGPVAENSLQSLPSRENGLTDDDDDDTDDGNPVAKPKREKIDLSHVQIRKMTSSRSKTKLKRRCSVNGHFYNRETKTFKPPHGSASNVWITSMVNTHEVINLLLDKFCVENNPEDFALYIVRENGEVRRVKDTEYPLIVRVMLGPHEEVAKVFIMDRNKTDEISSEVAQYLNFQEPELMAILRKYEEEEQREKRKIRLKYNEMRRTIKARLASLQSSHQISLSLAS